MGIRQKQSTRPPINLNSYTLRTTPLRPLSWQSCRSKYALPAYAISIGQAAYTFKVLPHGWILVMTFPRLVFAAPGITNFTLSHHF